MNRYLLYAVIWSALVLGAVADLAVHYPRLPEKVATHFNESGQADGWSTRRSYVWTWSCSVGLLPVMILGSIAAVRFLPARWVNVPHREFWLAPGQIEFTRAIVAGMVHWIGVATFLFTIVLNHLTLRANLTPEPSLGLWPWILLGALFIAMAVIIVPVMLRFRRPR